MTRCSQVLALSNSGKQFFEMIGEATDLPLGVKFQFAEIGAVNAWKSVGPFPIKEPSTAQSTFDSIWEQLQASPVGHNATHPKAIEFAFDSEDQTCHWFGFPISSDFPPFEISRESLRQALSFI